MFIYIISPRYYSVYSQKYEVKYLGIENGLSNNAVTSIFQDHQGFIWVGTYDGLSRYDGYSFKVFRNILGDSNTISSNGINALEEDSSHNLWVCNQKEVNVYNRVTQQFSRPDYVFLNGKRMSSLDDNVLSIKTVKKDLVLIGTQHYGLFRFDNKNKGTQIALNTPNGKVFKYYVNTIETNPTNNTAYVFVDDYGLCEYSYDRNELVLINDKLKKANCLKLSPQGKLWVGNDAGLYYYDSKGIFYPRNLTSATISVVNFCLEKDGTLWMATDGSGIWIVEKGTENANPLGLSKSGQGIQLNSNAIYAIHIDKDNRKWVGTLRGGINVIAQSSIFFKENYFKNNDSVNSAGNFISAFCEDTADNLWIGTDGAGLFYWNKNTGSYKNYLHSNSNILSLCSDFVTNIVKDKTGNIWVATWAGGINKFNRTNQTFKRYACFNKRTQSENSNVWRLFCDKKGRLWASAVRNGGVFIYNEQLDKFEEFDNTLNEIQVFAEDNEGNILGGDYSSLIMFDTINKKHKNYNIGFTVRSIYPAENGTIWVGTQGSGVLLFKSKQGVLKKYTTKEGLPNNTVLNILPDSKKRLWLSTYNGLSCLNLNTNTFTNYSALDGLQSNLFSYNAAIKLTNSAMLFGGIKGFNLFYPDTISIARKVPSVLLDEFTVNNLSHSANLKYLKNNNENYETLSITVPYNEATITLSYIALEYSRASEIKYAYKLKGWDKQWNYVNATRMALYSRLSPGSYSFEVIASTTNGEWSTPVTLINIQILSPWYRTWWAYLTYLIVSLGLIYLYWSYQRKQDLLKYQIKEANLEIQKERELAERKTEFFTNVSHEFRAPLSLILNPVKELKEHSVDALVISKLDIVQRNASRLLRLINQLLLFEKTDGKIDELNLDEVSLVQLCKDVYLYFVEQASSKRINYQCICEGDSEMLLVADNEKLEIAIFNLLSNAMKFTPDGGNIKLHLKENNSQFVVSIQDTGIGMPHSEKENIFKRFSKFRGRKNKSGFGIGLYLTKNLLRCTTEQ